MSQGHVLTTWMTGPFPHTCLGPTGIPLWCVEARTRAELHSSHWGRSTSQPNVGACLPPLPDALSLLDEAVLTTMVVAALRWRARPGVFDAVHVKAV